jgi:DNA-binding Lrp family transcriptional regulator
VKPARLAKRVGLGVKAVKERIAVMERAGVIAGYDAWPNLAHFPMGWTTFHFRVPQERRAAFSKALETADGVVGGFEFLGEDVCVDVFHHDDAERARRVRHLTALAGASPWEFYAITSPAVTRALTPLDWRILQALRHDAKRSASDIARSLRVTARTVRDRLDRMVGEGSLWIVPRVDHSRIPGFIPFGLLVYARADAYREATQRARDALAPDALSMWAPPSAQLGSLGAILRARTTGEMDEIRQRAADVPGIERVVLLVPTAMRGSSAWLDEEIDRRAGDASVSVSGPATPRKGSNDAPRAASRAPRER